ncbi:NAD-dependent epimerase/dehydratase family protein [Alicyclobacillus shizuokensis]|uniref:NAD-dependent epimerase/dehydratase family protein n=1 Tax=Alicyclobacillus shizuokensis TaxID=392014 RepID=UPI0008296B47|nr:NAD-dependent epimerase/dehydratase family protein [Alicyclobacillus shizuokensis]
MKFLVTGGAGFVGSHLVDKLLQLGHEVTTLDDLSNGKYNYIQSAMKHPNHDFVCGTIMDADLIDQLVSNHDGVFHLAAVLGVKNCVESPRKTIENNVLGTRNILESCFHRNKRVVFASTSEVYGKNSKVPFREDSDRVLGATMIHRWSYATAKALDEHLCLAYTKEGLQSVILRYFNIYGPRSEGTPYAGVIPIFIRAALENRPLTVYGDGRQTRCFTYVDDCVACTIAAMESGTNGMVFNVGTTDEISIMDLAHRIKRMTGSASEIVLIPYKEAYGEGYEDMQRRLPDLSRTTEVLKYTNMTPLDEGLRKTIRWHLEEMGLHDEGDSPIFGAKQHAT